MQAALDGALCFVPSGAAEMSTTCIQCHSEEAPRTTLSPVQICNFRRSPQAHKMNESTESARVPGMTPLLAGSLPESLPATMRSESTAVLPEFPQAEIDVVFFAKQASACTQYLCIHGCHTG